MLLIKRAHLFGPEDMGINDVLIGGEKILQIAETLSDLPKEYDVTVIDAGGLLMIPGLIDSHVHILGGGGEGGYRTRTPELMLTEVIKGGVTTVAGLLGTDGTTRTMSNLIAKANGLEEEGISTYIYTGSYHIPVRTVTGSILDDMILLNKVIGTGEVAISDHRSSCPTYEEFARVVADTRTGGILSGKAGLVNIHMGDGVEKLKYVRRVVEETMIPPSNMIPTHINRNPHLFADGLDYAKTMGGFIDMTTSSDPAFPDPDEVRACTSLRLALEAGVADTQVTFTSDGQGSLPVFDEKGNFLHLGVGEVSSVYREMKACVLEEGVALTSALKTVTSNPAALMKLPNKGSLKVGADADLNLVSPDHLDIQYCIAKGQIMSEHGNYKMRGTFEHE